MDLTLPLDYAAIERILPHRYPFLLVDRITEFEVDKRIVGIKNVSLNERYLSHAVDGMPVLPPTILTEVVAQVGAIMILAKPENRQRLPFFAGIERVRYRRPVHPGDVVGSKRRCCGCAAGWAGCRGEARVNGKLVADGTMTFALGRRIVSASGRRRPTRTAGSKAASSPAAPSPPCRPRRPLRPPRLRKESSGSRRAPPAP